MEGKWKVEWWRRCIRSIPQEKVFSLWKCCHPLPHVSAEGSKHQQNNFLLAGHDLGYQEFLLLISSHPMNYLSGLCTCDTTVTQAVNLIPLWWDSSQCQAQCGQSVPSDDTGHLHSDLWGDPMSQEQLLPSVASISPYKWPTKCWNPLFFPCNSKTSLPCKTAVKVYWVICSDRAHSLCS